MILNRKLFLMMKNTLAPLICEFVNIYDTDWHFKTTIIVIKNIDILNDYTNDYDVY